MASLSSIYLKLTGAKESLKSALQELKDYAVEYADLELSSISDLKHIGHGEYQCFVEGEGRWKAPQEFFYDGKIFKKYSLSGIFEDSERSSDFYYRAHYNNGIKTEEHRGDYFCSESIKAWGVDMWAENYEEDFMKLGWNACKSIRKVFNEAGYPDELLKLWYYYEHDTKSIVFIVGNNGTGKTTLANNLNEQYGFSIIKTDTTRPPRPIPSNGLPPNESKWYNFRDEIKMNETLEYTNFGGYLYATTKKSMELDNHISSRFVKIIEPEGLRMLLDHIEHIPNTFATAIYMDIDKADVIENLKKEGVPIEEIEKRLERGTIVQDMEKYNITPDVVIKKLDGHTTLTAIEAASKSLVSKIEAWKGGRYANMIERVEARDPSLHELKDFVAQLQEHCGNIGKIVGSSFDRESGDIQITIETPYGTKRKDRIGSAELCTSIKEKAEKMGIDIQNYRVQKEYLFEQSVEMMQEHMYNQALAPVH